MKVSYTLLLLGAYLYSCVALGQELPPREVQMQQRIDELESRLAEMEAVVKSIQSGQLADTPAQPESSGREHVKRAATADTSPQVTAPEPLEVFFNNGLQLRSRDGAFDIRVGGRTQLDAAFFDVDERWERLAALTPDFGLGDEDDGIAFRRARLSIRGLLYENIGFKAQYDFAVDSPGADGAQFRDVYFELHDLPFFDKVRLGHFQEPFSLEEMTSNSYMTFMERSLANVFVPSFNTGVTVEKTMLDKRLHWTLGLFKTTDFWPSDNDSREAQDTVLRDESPGCPGPDAIEQPSSTLAQVSPVAIRTVMSRFDNIRNRFWRSAI